MVRFCASAWHESETVIRPKAIKGAAIHFTKVVIGGRPPDTGIIGLVGEPYAHSAVPNPFEANSMPTPGGESELENEKPNFTRFCSVRN